MGVLGWTPTEFWAATPHDLHAALDGWGEARGQRATSGLDDEDIARLRQMIEASRER